MNVQTAQQQRQAFSATFPPMPDNAPQYMPAPMATNTSAMILHGDGMDRMFKIAEMMASGRATVPKHLQNNPADCLAVVMQATQWNLNPFAVAQKTFIAGSSGVLGYESQLIIALINNSGILVDRLRFEWDGPWEKIVGKFKEVTSNSKKDDNGNPKKFIVPAWNQADEHGLSCTVFATLRGDTTPTKLTLFMTQARTRNSTLWTEDPKQQLAYLAAKRFGRLHMPDVILGIYSPDELDDRAPKDMGPAEVVSEPAAPAADSAQIEAGKTEASKGREAFIAWWKQQTKASREAMHASLPEFERISKEADAKRTVADVAPKAQQAEQQRPAAQPAQAQPEPQPAAQAAAPEADPGITYADVLQKIQAAQSAQDIDALYLAADLIGAVPDQADQDQLSAMFEEVLGGMPQ